MKRMEIFPAAGVFFAIWLAVMIRNADNGLIFAIAVWPFGMFAAANLGGLSLLIPNLIGVLTIGALLLRRLSWQGPQSAIKIPISGIYLAAFAIYSVFSATVLVRVFQGDFMVFPMNVSTQYTQVSIHFPSTMWPLSPTNSNISQSFYILLSASFFLSCVFVLRRRGPQFAETGLAWAAGVNVLLGVLDLVRLDDLLSLIRTADYTLAKDQTMAGIERVIGGFAEASAFGATSATLASYFAMSYLIGGRFRDGALALGNLVFALLALSTTTFLAIGAGLVIITFHARTFLNRNTSRTAAHLLVVSLAGLVCAICLLVMLTPFLDMASELMDRLLLSKRKTLSGMERGAWAKTSIDAFFHTWGLGAGAGSLRGNGFLTVLLGSVGLPGTVAFMAFFAHTISKPKHFADHDAFRIFYSSRVCALTLFAALFVSATGPDPTLLLMAVMAMAVVAREVEYDPADAPALAPGMSVWRA